MEKLKLTIRLPHCKICRERAKTGNLKEILGILKTAIKDKLETGIPVDITIEKQSRKKKNEIP